jgi:hypothetical protein
MRLIARTTAIIFLIVGILVVLAGLYFAVSDLFMPEKTESSTFNLFPDLSGLMLVAKIIGGGAIGLQGLFLAAIGEVLWLLANISEETERTSVYMQIIGERSNQKKA